MAKLKINSTYNLGNGVSYTISAAHRRKSSKKADGQLVRMKSLLVFQIPLQTHGNKTFLRGDYI